MSERLRMRKLIEQEVLGQLPSRHRERLHDHLRSNTHARGEYDRAIEAFRVLEERDVAQVELDLVERWLFDERPAADEARAGAFGRLWAIVAVTAAAAAAAVLLLRTQLVAEPDEYMGVRDGSGVRLGLAIEALCSASPMAGSDEMQPASVSGCPLSGELSFAYRVDAIASLDAGVLTIFGVDGSGEVTYYAPTPADAEPIPIEVGRWQALPMTIALDVNHAPGVLRLYGLVTPVALTVDDVDEAASMLRARPATRAAWPTRLGGRGRIARICAPPQACLSAELTFRIHEDSP